MKWLKHLLIFVSLIFSLSACSDHQHEFYGYIEADLSFISAPATGKLLALFVNRGDIVAADQLLYQLEAAPDSFTALAAEDQAKAAHATWMDAVKPQRDPVIQSLQAQLRQAQALQDMAQITYNRNAKLVQQNYVQQQIVDQNAADLRAAKARVDQLTADIANAQLGAREDVIATAHQRFKAAKEDEAKAQWFLTQKNVAAPTPGKVIDTYYRVGEQVTAYQPVLSLLTPENIYVVFYIPEPLLGSLKVGQVLQIQCDSCKKSFPATVAFISPEAEYTPPIIYSNESKDKLVFRVEAALTPEVAQQVNPGQPVRIYF